MQVLPASFPTSFDVIIVSDVLYYIPYGGWPPALINARLVPASWLRPAQRRFFTRLQSLARAEVPPQPCTEGWTRPLEIATTLIIALGQHVRR